MANTRTIFDESEALEAEAPARRARADDEAAFLADDRLAEDSDAADNEDAELIECLFDAAGVPLFALVASGLLLVGTVVVIALVEIL